METPVSGDAIIQHSVTGASRNLGISTTGNLTMTADNIDLSSAGRLIVPTLSTGDYLDYNPATANLTLSTNNTGTPANPMLTLNQTDTATGAGTMKFYKNLSVVGNDIGVITFNANTTTATNQEYARIASTIRSNTSGNLDGSIGLFARVNNSNTEFIRVNGVDSQTEFLQPIDMNNNAITTGTGDLVLNTTASSGTGTIILAPNAGASVNIPSEADPTNDFIRINPQTSANSQQLLMTATDTGGFKNSINLLNLQYRPYLELKAEFGTPIKSLALDVDGAGSSNNKIVAVDTQTNLPLQIDTSGYTNGSIELKVNDTSGDIILTGSALESNTSTGGAGKYLRLKINGTYYKLALEND